MQKHTVTIAPSMEVLPGRIPRFHVCIRVLTTGREAVEDLTGGVTTELFTTDILDTEKFWNDELLKVNKEFLFGCGTGSFDTWQGADSADRKGVIGLHAYSVIDAREINGERLVRIR